MTLLGAIREQPRPDHDDAALAVARVELDRNQAARVRLDGLDHLRTYVDVRGAGVVDRQSVQDKSAGHFLMVAWASRLPGARRRRPRAVRTHGGLRRRWAATGRPPARDPRRAAPLSFVLILTPGMVRRRSVSRARRACDRSAHRVRYDPLPRRRRRSNSAWSGCRAELTATTAASSTLARRCHDRRRAHHDVEHRQLSLRQHDVDRRRPPIVGDDAGRDLHALRQPAERVATRGVGRVDASFDDDGSLTGASAPKATPAERDPRVDRGAGADAIANVTAERRIPVDALVGPAARAQDRGCRRARQLRHASHR